MTNNIQVSIDFKMTFLGSWQFRSNTVERLYCEPIQSPDPGGLVILSCICLFQNVKSHMVPNHDDHPDEKIKLSKREFIELNNELGKIRSNISLIW